MNLAVIKSQDMMGGNIKTFESFEESLNHLIQREKMVGDNQWTADEVEVEEEVVVNKAEEEWKNKEA